MHDGHHHVQAFHHAAEDRIVPVEVGPVGQGDIELAAIGVRTGVGHAQDAGPVVAETGRDFIGNRVVRAFRGFPDRPAGLDDVTGNDAMEFRAVEKRPARGQDAVFDRPLGQPDEVGRGQGRLCIFQFKDDESLAGRQAGQNAVFRSGLAVRMNGQGRKQDQQAGDNLGS